FPDRPAVNRPGILSMMFRLHALLRGHWLVAGCAMGMFGALGAQTVGPVADRAPAGNTAELHPMDDPVVKLDAVEVSAGLDDPEFDGTGMGSYEHQLRETPFWNDMISIEALEDDPAAAEVAAELAAIAAPSAVDLATGDSRVGLRGFPTPQMSSGFVGMGGIDFLNTARTIVIQGALVPVLGRAAPGGIQDVWTNRPRTSKARRFDYSISSLERQTASLEI